MATGPRPAGAALTWPDHLAPRPRDLLTEVARRNRDRHGDAFLGLLLSGSAGRGLATERSDVDVYVVLSDEVTDLPDAARSRELDELPIRLGELESVPSFGTPGWWFRWSFAWAPVLLDRTGGRIAAAAERQATLTAEEADEVLIEGSRLDGWINAAYRALKSDRKGHRRECRLDAAEAVPWLLDVVFAFDGRVRPSNSYLAWELRTHPLQHWPGDLLRLIERLLDGDPDALRETFAMISVVGTAYDEHRGDRCMQDVIAGWSEELELFA